MKPEGSSERRPLLLAQRSNSDKRVIPTPETNLKAGSQDAEDSVGLVIEQPSRWIEDDVIPEVSPLGRNITWPSAYILIISRVIGSGIFATPGTILKSVGSPGLSLLLWVAGAVIAACGLAVSIEYGCMLPRSGGNKVYLEFTYRKPRFLASVLIAIIVIFLGFTSSNCIIFSQYTLFALGLDASSGFLRKAVAVGLLSVVTVIHGAFPRVGMKLQDIFGWIKISVIIFMVFSGAFAVVFRPTEQFTPKTMRQGLWDQLWQDSNWNWGIIATSLFKVFYSYSGLENVNNVLNEVKDPVRTLRSVSLAALITVCGMYLLINVAFLIVIPIDEIKQSGELISALFFERLFGETIGRTVLPLAVSLSAIGNVMVVAFATVSYSERGFRVQRLTIIGSCQAGDCKARPYSVPRLGLIYQTIQLASGRLYTHIRSIFACYHRTSFDGSLFVHLGR